MSSVQNAQSFCGLTKFYLERCVALQSPFEAENIKLSTFYKICAIGRVNVAEVTVSAEYLACTLKFVRKIFSKLK